MTSEKEKIKNIIDRIDPDSKDPVVRGVFNTFFAQAEMLNAHWSGGGPVEVAPPSPAVGGRIFISEELAEKINRTDANVSRLVRDRDNRRKANRERGRENQSKGDGEERERAARDMETALRRVRERVKEKEKAGGKVCLLDECRAACREFTQKSGRKNEFGKCADGYYPLTGAGDKPIKAETLARNYRTKYGTKGSRKEVGAR